MPLIDRVELLSPSQVLTLFIPSCSIAAHLIFKRYEPSSLVVHALLLCIVPLSLSVLLAAQLGIVKGVLLTFGAYYASLSTSILCYRLSPFHPYSRYPGPVMCKISKIWLAWICSRGRQHLYIRSLHDEYGDVVRIGPNEISIRDASVVNAFMGTHGLPKGPNWSGRIFLDTDPSLVAIQDPHEHLVRRKPWSRALNIAAIKEFQPILTARVSQLVDAIGSETREFDLSRWLGYFTYDFMCDMVFGGGSEMMRDGDPEHVWHQMETAMISMMWLDHLPWLGRYAAQFQGAVGGITKFRKMARRRIAARRQAGSSRKDLMYSLSNEDIGAEESPREELLMIDGVLAIIAGSDTTSGVLSNAFYFALSNPDVYKRLQDEVGQYYPPGEDSLDPKYYPEMSYLDAVISETLRLMPAVPSGSQRTALRGSGGKMVGNYFIPERNQVRIHFYSVQRDPRNFTDPDKFWPERWLIAEGIQPWSGPFIHNLNAFTPFSHGPANCVGKPLAMQEMRTVLCHMIQKLDLRFAPEWDPQTWEREIQDYLVVVHGALPVVARRRC